ncbi:MAG TPA: cytochrome c [Pirellulaceae bacterium]|nr:cytochrome c [Pirellulaceae bacterium]
MTRSSVAVATFALVAVLATTTGCLSQPAEFETNAAYLYRTERARGEDFRFEPSQTDDVERVLTEWFGTPDDPRAPKIGDLDFSTVLDADRLTMASGAVYSDQEDTKFGLYREHCAHCHGVTGDGKGPTAPFLNPYPRDYRMGVFKFKSTPRGSRPTHDDLRRILVEGIPGTSMPSFRLLKEEELESLVDYVRYLSIRGEVERALIGELNELGEGQRLLPEDAPADDEAAAEQKARVLTNVKRILDRWAQAEQSVSPVPPRPAKFDDPEELAAAIERGKAIFHGDVGNCARCHGTTALGDGQTTDFDDWTKEYDPLDAAVHQIYVDQYDVLPARNAKPRNLRLGALRGGRRPVDIYWRLANGIDGTPMPAVLTKPEGSPADVTGLTPEEMWSLIEYVRSLPYDELNDPYQAVPANVRERP